MLRIIGFVLLVFSFAVYGILLLIPFFEFSAKTIAVISTSVIVAAETSFYLSIVILGKQLWSKFKDKMLTFFGIRREKTATEDDNCCKENIENSNSSAPKLPE